MGYVIALPEDNLSALFIRMSPRVRGAVTAKARHAYVFRSIEEAQDMLATLNTTWRRSARIKKLVVVRAYVQEPSELSLDEDLQLALPEQTTTHPHQIDVV